MSNIDITNIKYKVNRKIYKILGMNMSNYQGTYDYVIRQTINYEKTSDGRDKKKFITVISTPEGNLIDYMKGRQSDYNNFNYGKRCVFEKNGIVITKSGTNPSSALMTLKLKAITKIILNLAYFFIIIYLIFMVISYFI